MARDLHTDMETLRTVLAHVQNRDFVRASALAGKTLAEGFEHPLLLNVMATQLEHEGKFEESLALLQRAVTIAPKDVGTRNALALCLQALNRPAEALLHVDELLTQQPKLGFAHANKGNALMALGWLGQAKAAHQRALELEPGNFIATAGLASIATQRGEHEEARRWAERTLQSSPGFPDAVISLAAAELAAGAKPRAESLLHGVIIDSRVGPADKARATGLLGDVLDAGGRYAEAFDAYTNCNESLRQIHRAAMSGSSMLMYTRSLAAAMSHVDARAWRKVPMAGAPAAAPDIAGHAFLLGFPRSGTTLLEVVLDGHPQVASIEEHELLTDGVLRFMREPVDFEPLALAHESQLDQLRAVYWEGVRRAGTHVAGKVFIDKHPLNTLKLPLIARLFPGARILFAYRDPRDVVLGCFRRRFKMNPSMYELLTLSSATAFYDAVMAFADQVRPVLGLEWRDVRYENLVADLTGESAAICDFLRLEQAPGLGDFATRVQNREHATPSTAQLARGLDRSGIGHWQNYAAPLQAAQPTLERWVERFGYER